MFDGSLSLLNMKCSLIGWATHFLFTFFRKTSMKFFFNAFKNSAKWPGLLLLAPNQIIFSIKKKNFRDFCQENVISKCDTQPIKEHFIFSKD